jgi:DNA primase catalytic subunit
MENERSIKEQRVRAITNLYYSNPEVQQAMFEFSSNREISPQYFEGFGKRPDSLQYKGDILELAKKGTTSFHCSEELWQDPMNIITGMTEKEANELRIGWDLLLDIDSRYIDYSKIMVRQILKVLKFHGLKNIGIKFSGSKGFHLIIPWKAFPKKVNEVKTSDMFPEWPRIILQYINEKVNKGLVTEITKLTTPNKYIKDWKASEEVIPDLVLVSSRHLFRMPYSLHEKTSLASVVLTPEEVKNFQLKDADALKVKVKKFMPDVEEGEASELLMQALDWWKDKRPDEEEKTKGKFANFKPIELKNITEEQFPPCVKKILKGVNDGRKRSLFVLINLFRSIGIDKVELEKRIDEWNKKNEVPLKQGYITSQLNWSYRKKPIMPQNCKDFYKGIGVCDPDDFCKFIKNPVNYVVRKNFLANKKTKKKKPKKIPTNLKTTID